ncbi:MAG TPA: hypothetical protein VGC83_18970 [Solirubrobacteraceae bacterium]|jgi:hypothetical protein
MPGHGNFTSVTLDTQGGADALKVNGETTLDVDLVKTILIVVTPEKVAQGLLSTRDHDTTDPAEPPSASVALPAGQSHWTVTFSSEQAPFDLHATLFLTGVMTSEDTSDAFVWQQALTIAADTAPAKVA